MQLTLCPSGTDQGEHRSVDLELRHEPLPLPDLAQAAAGEAHALLPIDVLGEDKKQAMQIDVALDTGELELRDVNETWSVAESRTADELRLTLYSRLLKAWEAQTPASDAEQALLARLQAEVERLASREPSEQAPGISQA